MKPFLIQTISLAACILIASCSRQNKTENAETVPAAAEPVAATPEPKAVVAATPAPKRLAPDGTFFLLVKKSVETSDGIIGLAPGTKIRQQADGRYAADGHYLELKTSEITNDLDIAAHYAGADARAQSAIKDSLQAHATAPKPGAPTSAPSSSATAASRTTPSTPVPAAPRAGSGLLGQNSALGSAHTKVQGGWVYQKDATGNWVPVRPTR
jgi:hypothetical protein